MAADPITADFAGEWLDHAGTTGPLAHHLREAGLRPWIRLHALPNSKRYAETKEETQIILKRANQLATEVLGEKSDCWLVQCKIDATDQYAKAKIEGVAILNVPEPDEEYHWTVYASASRWEAGAFDRLLRKIAQDRTGPTLWINRANGAIFAPYDGGFDLFPISQQEVKSLRDRHSSWLSNEPSGL